jgi:ATP-dependent helicase HepA
MHTAHFPYLQEDGMTVTFDRATALAHEDVEYLSWEHPMTQGVMDLVAGDDHGKAVVVGVDFDLLPRGSLLIETIHVLEIVAPNAPELRRFVSTTMCQFIRDEHGRSFSKLINSRKLFRNVRNVENSIVRKLVKLRRPKIVSIIEQNERDAKATFAGVIETARSKLITTTERELERLTYLQSVNASVRSEEIDLIREQLDESLQSFSKAQARLDAVRLIVIF